MTGLLAAQDHICRRFSADFLPTPLDARLCVALESLTPGIPLHGTRRFPDTDSCGWYIWAGDRSDSPGFFRPLKAELLSGVVPQVLPYLGLGPGWRFLLATGYEDVWHDPTLLAAPAPPFEAS